MGVSSLTWSHTVASGATSLFVSAYLQSVTATISSITWNGSPLSLVVSGGRVNNQISETWAIFSPASGTANIVVTYSIAVLNGCAGGTSFLGSETTFTGATGSAAAAAGSPSITFSTNGANSIIHCMAGGGNNDIDPPGSGQTAQWTRLDFAGGSHDCVGSTKPTTTAGSYTVSYGGGQVWNMVAAEVREATVVGYNSDFFNFM